MSDDKQAIEEQVNSVKASFAMEGIELDSESLDIGRRILSGEKVDDEEIKRKIERKIAELRRNKATQA